MSRNKLTSQPRLYENRDTQREVADKCCAALAGLRAAGAGVLQSEHGTVAQPKDTAVHLRIQKGSRQLFL